MAAEFNRVENPDEANNVIRHDYQPFFAAIKSGDWHEAKKFLAQHPNAIRATDFQGTALHNATVFGHEHIVEELLQLMTEQDLEIKDSDGWTALALAARENIKMVKCMVGKNKKLLSIAVESEKLTPILLAALYDQWDIVRYLYSITPIEDLMPDKGHYGSELVSFCLFAKQFDIAWELLQHCPRLTSTRGVGRTPIFAFAIVPSAFPSGTSLKFWQRWIYKC